MKLKIICLNMWRGGALFDNIKSFITQEKADLLALQEVYHAEDEPPQQQWHNISALARILGYPHYAFNPAFSQKREGQKRVQNGNAILSKFPISSSTSTWYDKNYQANLPEILGDYTATPRNLQHAEIAVDSKTLHIFNTQGIWGFDGEDNDRRLHMGEVIAQEVAGKQPALLMGDFNVKENTQTIQKVEQQMRNIFKGELTTSFNMQHKSDGGFATAVVDMMFASPDVKIVNHYASKENVSDHLALVAEVEI